MEAIPFGQDEPTRYLEMPHQTTYESEKSLPGQPVQGSPKETPGHDLIHASNRAIHPEVCCCKAINIQTIGLQCTRLSSIDGQCCLQTG